MRRKGGYVEDIAELGGLSKTNLGVAFVLAMLMFSLAGIPPLAGFWAKWYVFLAAVKAGLWPLAIIGVIASVVGCYYYLRIVKVMFFDDAKEGFLPVQGKVGFVMAPPPLMRARLRPFRATEAIAPGAGLLHHRAPASMRRPHCVRARPPGLCAAQGGARHVG